MLDLLKQWQLNQQIRAIDYHFAKFMQQLGADNLTQLAAALVSEQLGQGHICLPLDKLGDLFHQHCLLSGLDSHQQSQSLNISCIFHDVQQTHLLLSENICCGEGAPLSLEYNALFMARYAEYEQLIAERLFAPADIVVSEQSQRQLQALFAPELKYLWADWSEDSSQSVVKLCVKYFDVLEGAELDWQAIQDCFDNAKSSTDLLLLNRLIPDSARCDWQKVSAALALSTARCVISGGPGTGKTTTVVKLLALLLQAQPSLSIKMVAPTGKAAARLTESITNTLSSLTLDEELKALIPSEASTIHRLLGVQAHSAHFRYNQDNPLVLDLLLVDEASMVDLPLMAKLLSALPDHARLILLGDKDQLASVEAGAVLGDICSFLNDGYSQAKAQLLSQLTGFSCLTESNTNQSAVMADQLCLLTKSYRFDQYSGIGFLARAVNGGEMTKSAFNKLCTSYQDLEFINQDEQALKRLKQLIIEGYQPYLAAIQTTDVKDQEQVRALLNLFNDFKLLCATREGEWGVKELNKLCFNTLNSQQLLPELNTENRSWYNGRPVMISENSYHLNLFNGDIGLCLAGQDGALRVYFAMADGTIADFQPSRLPAHDTVFAMTVHKSQGSEFRHTLLALPNYASPVVNRELIYTGITRAKKQLTLIADLPLMLSSIKHRATRYSRLRERLANKSEQFEPIKVL